MGTWDDRSIYGFTTFMFYGLDSVKVIKTLSKKGCKFRQKTKNKERVNANGLESTEVDINHRVFEKFFVVSYSVKLSKLLCKLLWEKFDYRE